MSNWPLILHINYFEPGVELRDACRIARELGADGIEFRQRPGGFAGTSEEYLDALSSALDAFPLDYVSFGAPGPNLMLPSALDRQREVQRCIAFYNEAAKRYGTTLFNSFTGGLSNPDPSVSPYDSAAHGSAIAKEEHWQWAVEGFQSLAREAKTNGYQLGFESHGHYLHDSIASCVRLVQDIGSPEVGVIWDHANLLLVENPPTFASSISDLGRGLFAVHLKNWLLPPRFHPVICLLEEGILNVREQLRLLRDSGFQGPICVESPRNGDRLNFVRRDVACLNDLMHELGMRWSLQYPPQNDSH